MTIRHLRIFAEVYRFENITRAAEELHLTQPAVTRAIRELEDYYGTRLFERMYHRIFPTESGRRLYPQVLQLLDSFERIETGLRNWDSLGYIRVGATVTLGDTVLPGLTRRFLEENPGSMSAFVFSKTMCILPWDCLLPPVRPAGSAVLIVWLRRTEAFIPAIFMYWISGNWEISAKPL